MGAGPPNVAFQLVVPSLPQLHRVLGRLWAASSYGHHMNRLGTTLSQILLGTLADGADPQALIDAMVAAGHAPDEVVVLAGPDGLDELLGHARGHGILGHLTHLMRHIEALDSDGTGHVLAAAERDLRAGHTVVLVLHVNHTEAATLSALLHVFGVPHVHYIGRWTVAQHGTIPATAN